VTAIDSHTTFFEKFEDTRPIFKGMEAHYKAEVVPVLEEMDKERVSTFNTALICQAILACVGLGIFIMFAVSENLFGMAFVVIPTIVLMALTWRLSTKTFVSHAKTAFIGGVVSFFDWTYSGKCDAPLIFQRLKTLRFFGSHDKKIFRDQISGTAFGKAFTLTEIFLTRTETSTRTDHNGNSQTDTRTVTVFDGCLITIDVDEKFSGETIVLRKGFLFNPGKVKGLKRVGLVSSKFENVFNAYGSDQVEARYLLDPTLIEQIIAYENAFKGKRIRFAFIDQNLHIVIETGARFPFKRLSESLLAPYRIKSLLKEIEATFNLIEGLIAKKPADWKEEFGTHPMLTKAELDRER